MPIWGKFWWVGGTEHRWMFFDDDKSSETYARQITRCRGCGTMLERERLRMAAALSEG
jgi:hypothetical protein